MGFIKTPSSEKKWLKIAAEFEDKWNFVGATCLGAIDGNKLWYRLLQEVDQMFLSTENVSI